MDRIRVLIFHLMDFSFESRSYCRDVPLQVWKCVFILRLFLQGSVWVGIRDLIFHLLGFSFESKLIVETHYLRYGSAFFL